MFLSHSRQHQEPQHKDRLVAYTLSELIRTGYLVDRPWAHVFLTFWPPSSNLVQASFFKIWSRPILALGLD